MVVNHDRLGVDAGVAPEGSVEASGPHRRLELVPAGPGARGVSTQDCGAFLGSCSFASASTWGGGAGSNQGSGEPRGVRWPPRGGGKCLLFPCKWKGAMKKCHFAVGWVRNYEVMFKPTQKPSFVFRTEMRREICGNLVE